MNNANVKIGALELLEMRKHKKRFSLGAVVFFVLLCLTAIIAYPALKQISQVQTEVGLWTDGLTAQVAGTETWAGTGTEEDAFKLASVTDLAQLAVNVNAGTTYAGQYFELTSDINMIGKEWVPIGTFAHPFMGTFDGAKHFIYFMTITGTYGAAGLFGYVEYANLTHINMVSSYINVTDTYAGGIVGYGLNTDISYCTNDAPTLDQIGFLTDDPFDTSMNSVSYVQQWLQNAQYRGELKHTGGRYDTIHDGGKSYETYSKDVSVYGEGDAGGIIGRWERDESGSNQLEYCWNTGRIYAQQYAAGGIAGSQDCGQATLAFGEDAHLHLKYCANAGSIKGGSAGGGITGWFKAWQDYRWSATVSVTASYSLGSVTSNQYKGALIGHAEKDDRGGGGSPYCRIGSEIGSKGQTNNMYCYYSTSLSGLSSYINVGESSVYSSKRVAPIAHVANISTYTQKAQYLMSGYQYDSTTDRITTTTKASLQTKYWDSSNWERQYPTETSNGYRFIAIVPYDTPMWSANTTNSYVVEKAGAKYKVTLKPNGGSGSDKTIQVTYGKVAPTVTIPTRTGYTFTGYYTSASSGTQYINKNGVGNRNYDMNANDIWYAHWEANEYQVRFNRNGGRGSMSDQTFTYGRSQGLSANQFYRSGYEFLGWATSSYSTTVRYTDGQSVKNLTTEADDVITLYAVWGIPSITITLRAPEADENARYWNYISGWDYSGKTASADIDDSSTLSQNGYSLPEPSREGYYFEYWMTGSGSRVNSGTYFYNDTTLYAEWTAKTSNIYFDPGEGSGGSTSTKVTYGSSMPRINVPSRTHYTFEGYYTGRNGSGTKYYNSSGTSYQSWGEDVASDTLYANWTPANITVSFNTNGGSYVAPTTVRLDSTFGSLTKPTREGWEFVNWHYDSSLSSSSVVTSSTVLRVSMLPSTANSITLYAEWKTLSYNITLQANEADFDASQWTGMNGWTASNKTAYQHFDYGDIISSMPTPTRSGYEFDGWYTSSSGGTRYDVGSLVRFPSTTTLYAHWREIDYTLTINFNGGTYNNSTNSITVVGNINEQITLPTTTRVGYQFANWSNSSGAGSVNGTRYTFGAGNGSVTANWTARTYTLSFYKNDDDASWVSVEGFTQVGSGNSVYYTKTVTYDQAIGPMPTVGKIGYNPTGWYTSGTGGTQYNESTVYKNSDDMALYAHYAENTYVLTINKANGDPLQTEEGQPGDTFTLPTPHREGYTLSTWEITSGPGTYNGGIFTFSSGNTIIQAKWDPIIYYVNYDGNGATGGTEMTRSEFKYGQLSQLKTNTYERSGFRFSGWSLDAMGSGTIYGDGSNVLNLTSTNGTVITLYAVWQSIMYDVIYDAVGGIIQETGGFDGVTGRSTSTVSYQYNSRIEVLPNVQYTGYTFLGWFTSDDEQIEQGYVVTAGATFYAHYAPMQFTVTLYGQGGTLSQVDGWNYSEDNLSASRTIDYNSALGTLPTPTLVGSNFVGWFGDPIDKTDQFVSTSLYTYVYNLEIYAHYNVNRLMVVFDANGGEVSTPTVSRDYGSVIGELPVPARGGFTFKHWVYNTNTSQVATANDTVRSDITLVAQWDPAAITITFDGNTGTLVADENFPTESIQNNRATKSVYYDSEYGVFPSVSQAGASFLGWFDDRYGDGNQYLPNSTVKITENITLYAVFSPEKYTVTFNANGGFCSISERTYNYNEVLGYLPSTTREGYTLLGWSKEYNGTTYVSETDLVTQSMVLYACWAPITYTIEFDANRDDAVGGPMEPITAQYGISVELPTNLFSSPTADFIGWTQYSDGSGTIYLDGQNVVDLSIANGSTVVLYALWQQYEYTVSIASLGGTFTVLYDFEQSGTSARKTYYHGDQLGTLPEIELEGYTFDGYKDVDTDEPVDYSTYVTENMSLEPIFTPRTITVVFDAGEGTFDTENESFGYELSNGYKTATIEKDYGDTYGTLPTATLTGYTVEQYLLDDETPVGEMRVVRSEEDTITVYIEYAPVYVVVTFDAQGGSIDVEGQTQNVLTLSFGYETVYGELPTPTRQGFTFLGWFTQPNGEGEEITAASTVNSVTNFYLYAAWRASNYTLWIDLNGGTYDGEDGPQTGTITIRGDYGQTVWFADITRPGYQLTGFNVGPESAGQLVNDPINGYGYLFGNDNASIQANWEAQPITITLDYGLAGAQEPAEIIVYVGQKYSSLPVLSNDVYEGYTFAGWFREATFENVVVATDTVIDTADTTFYANWTQNVYTLSVNLDGGTVDDEEFTGTYTGSYDAENPTTITLPLPKRAGYDFRGWNVQQNDYYKGSVDDSTGSYVFTFGNGNGSIIAIWNANNYTIHFDGNGATSGTMSSLDAQVGTYIDLTENGFDRTGYNFTGWNTDKDGNGTAYRDGTSVVDLTLENNGEVTLFAQWQIMSLTLTIDPNGGLYNGSNNVTAIIRDYGSTVPVQAPTRFGYAFTGYTATITGTQTPIEVSLEGDAESGYTFLFPDTNITLTAGWERITITVTLDPNEGTWQNVDAFGEVQEDNTIDLQVQSDGTFGNLPTAANLVKAGYTFEAWVDPDGSEVYSTSTVSWEENITLTAKYAPQLYRLTINPNGGSYNNSTDVVEFTGEAGETIDLLTPDRVGHSFTGWNITSGNGTANRNSFTFGSQDAVISAQWAPNEYTIYFSSNGGDGAMDSVKTTYGSQVILPANTFTRLGYEFAGWNSRADGTGQSYSDGASITNLTDEVNGQITLYARWNALTFTVNFDANLGSTNISVMEIRYGNTFETMPIATRAGYEFLGWYTELEEGEKIESDYQVSSNMTLYAHWKANSYTITFDAGEGTIIANEGFEGEVGGHTTTKQVTYGEQYGALPSVSHGSMAFLGWFTSPQVGTQVFSDSLLTLADDQTLYARYDTEYINVTFNAQGGVLEYSQIRLFVGYPYELPAVERVGYKFDGWYLLDEKITEETIVTRAEDHTLVARWNPISVQVTFNFAGASYVDTVGFEGDVYDDSATLTVFYGEPFGILPNMYKIGQMFDGWYMENGNRIYDTLDVSLLENFTVTAKFSDINYNLIINPNGGTYDGESGTTTFTNSYGSRIDLLIPERYGYEFTGWNNTTTYGSVEGSVEDGFAFIFGEGTTTIVAQWSPKLIVVTFDAVEGIITSTGISVSEDRKTGTKSYDFGATYGDLPVAQLDGYRFKGWFTVSGNGGVQMNTSSRVEMDEDFRLYAQYEKIEYTLFVNPNNGTFNGTSDITQYTGSIDATQPIAMPTRTGYEFEGWVLTGGGNIEEDGDAFIYTFGSSNGTITASWKAETYLLTFDYQGADGGNTVASKDIIYGTPYGTLPTPTRTGYDFTGWYTQSVDGDIVYSTQLVTRAEAHTLYAHWEIQKWTLRVILNGGSIDEGDNVAYKEYSGEFGQTIEFNQPTRYGYDFDGFDQSGEGTYSIQGGIVSFVLGDTDVVLVTNWLAKQGVVTLDAGLGMFESGLNTTTINVTYGLSYGALPIPTRDGYNFAGWKQNPSDQDYIISSTTVNVEGNHTLYADWREKTSTLTLILDGGTLATEGGLTQWERPFGSTIQFGVPTKEGYEFDTYTLLSDDGKLTSTGEGADRIYTFTFGSTDAVITATYRAQTLKVTLDADGGTIQGAEGDLGETVQISVYFGDRYDAIDGTLPTAYKAGYTFDGWQTSDGNIVVGATTVSISQDHTLTAKYTPITYTLTIDLNGGTIGGQSTIAPQQMQIGQSYTFSADPQKTGYDFIEFRITSGSGQLTNEDGVWKFIFTDSNASVEAIYEAREFTLTFDLNGHDVDIPASTGSDGWTVNGNTATKTVKYDSPYGALPALPKDGNSVFLGWFLGQDDGADQITSIVTVKIENDTIVYAHWGTSTYLLTLELDGGAITVDGQELTRYSVQASATNQITLEFDDDSLPHKAGYDFIEYEVVESGGGTLDPNGGDGSQWTFTMGEGNAVIRCVFKAIDIVVTLNANGGTFGTYNEDEWDYNSGNNTLSRTYQYGGTLGILPTVTLNGYEFSGWFIGDQQYTNTYQIEWLTAQTLVADFRSSNFTLVIDPNGGTYEGSSTAVEKSLPYGGEPYTVSDPIREGYTFEGWTEVASVEGQGSLVDGQFTIGAGNYTLIASWKAITYTIVFDAGGGEGTMEPQVFTYDVAKVLSTNTFTREGYVFDRWVDTQGRFYDDKALVQNLTTVQGQEFKLTAQWSGAIYNVYYDANNGTARPIATQAQYGSTFGALATDWPTATREGYTFSGWYTAIIDGEPQGDEITPSTPFNYTNDLTLVAYWVIEKYTITLPQLDSNAATINVVEGYDPNEVYYNNDFAFSIEVKEAYNESVLQVYANDTPILNINGVYYINRVADNIMVRVEGLTINTYVVTFNSIDGSYVAPYTSVPYGSLIEPPEDPTLLHYDFVAWYKDSALTQEFDFATERIYEDITLYAAYTRATYTVTFYLSEENPQQYGQVQYVAYMDTATRPTDPYMEGYNFWGWCLYGSSELYNFNSQVTGDIELYGHYIADSFEIRFMNGNRVITRQYRDYGEFVTLPEANIVNIEGYNLIGWYADANFEQPFDFEGTTVTQDMYIYGKYEAIVFTVEFYVDGQLRATRQVAYNGKVIAPNDIEVPEGNHIVSWYYDSDLTRVFDFNTTIDSNLSLYGRYELNDLVISFVINGQTELRYATFGSTLAGFTLPTLPSLTGYTQVAPYYSYVDSNNVTWRVYQETVDGNIMYYLQNANGEKIYFDDFVITSNMVFNAVYTINVYTVTFIMPDGTTVIKTVEHGGTLTDVPQVELGFGDRVAYDQSLSNIQGNLTVNVSIENFIKIPLIIVGAILCLAVIALVVYLSIKAYKKKHSRDKIRELIDTKGH